MQTSIRSIGDRAPHVLLKHLLMTTALLVCTGLILTASLHSQEATPKEVVNVGTFTVEAPEGDDWTTEVNLEKGSVEFIRGKQKVLSFLVGGAGGGTSISVFRARLETEAPGVWLMNESQTADFYRDRQLKKQIEKGSAEGLNTTDVRKDTVLIDGTMYYLLAYTVSSKTISAIEMFSYLYFPKDFSRKRDFYVFTIMESYTPGSIWASKDFEQIKPVLKSLRPIDPLEGITGPEGDLLRACARGDSLRVSQLVGQGVNVNTAVKGQSPLVLASSMGQEGIVRFLVERGALLSPGGGNEEVWPLSAAILAREFNIARYLVQKGANVDVRSSTGWSPLMRAVMVHADSVFVSALLRRGAAADERNEDGRSSLILAARDNLPDLCLVLLAGGADPNLRAEGDRWTAIMFAAEYDAVAAARVLLNHEANPNLASNAGNTAGYLAARKGSLEILELLAAHGADFRAKTKRGVNALHAATYNVHPACMRFLLDRGVDINETDNYGWTPLMYAAESGDTTAVKLLIENRAALNAKNARDRTALDIAESNDHDAVVEIMKKAGADD